MSALLVCAKHMRAYAYTVFRLHIISGHTRVRHTLASQTRPYAQVCICVVVCVPSCLQYKCIDKVRARYRLVCVCVCVCVVVVTRVVSRAHLVRSPMCVEVVTER